MKKQILIYRLGSLGDTVITLPCFHLVREKYPDAEITLLTNKPVASKAAPVEAVLGTQNSFFYDRIIHYPIGTRNPLILLNILLQIRRLGIQTIINVTEARSKRAATRDKLFFWLAGIREMIGFPEKEEDFQVALDPETGQNEWEARRLSRRIEKLGKIDLNHDTYWDLRITEEEKCQARELLKPFPLNSNIVAISVGTKMQSKDWGIDNWIRLIRKLHAEMEDWTLLLLGAKEEYQQAELCLQAWNGSGINLCGKTTPRVSAAILKKAKVFIGHDSGPMHLAASVGTPCVAVFSARSIQHQWYPRGENNRIIYHQVSCAGCGLDECTTEGKRCILSIRVDEVHKAVREVVPYRQERITR
ncbi:glycosyltransferase family 9 protein [Telluribacter humicola]|uniref:glycosyltransferase family 9 protein n=1 Tax=Telluribacter humicola TaxID=1720261 RepID=UPI001A971414|nr:glycosyltransferase family 9 protein [Telluribacter humicola]